MTTFDGDLVQIDYAADAPSDYRAGACNIGPEEIARRRRAGLVAIGIAAVVAVALVVIDAPAVLRLAVFPPLASGLVSLEQVRRRFCVGFALAGLRNFGPLGTPDRVTDDADLAADRRAALRMIAHMSTIALAVSLAFVALAV
jgi:hypothetical protein